MPRTARAVRAGGFYHLINRGNGRQEIFHKDGDYAAFARILAEGVEEYPVDLLAWCLMPNHWHLVVSPRTKPGLARFMGWVGVTHVRRHHEHYHTRGGGHLYQGRFKSFPIQDDPHFLTVCRYVESNARRAAMVEKAEDWPWSSLRAAPPATIPPPKPSDGPHWPRLTEWPLKRPRDWSSRVNRPIPKLEMERLRTSVNRGRPFGEEEWVKRTAVDLGLTNTLRDAGRPKKARPKNQ